MLSAYKETFFFNSFTKEYFFLLEKCHTRTPSNPNPTTLLSASRPFPIMLIKLAFYAPTVLVLRQKNAHIVLDSEDRQPL